MSMETIFKVLEPYMNETGVVYGVSFFVVGFLGYKIYRDHKRGR